MSLDSKCTACRRLLDVLNARIEENGSGSDCDTRQRYHVPYKRTLSRVTREFCLDVDVKGRKGEDASTALMVFAVQMFVFSPRIFIFH